MKKIVYVLVGFALVAVGFFIGSVVTEFRLMTQFVELFGSNLTKEISTSDSPLAVSIREHSDVSYLPPVKLDRTLYSFSLISARREFPENVVGIFHFRHENAQSLPLYGFEFEPDQSFRTRFPEYQKLENGEWRDIEVWYSGTGARSFMMLPGQEYVFEVDLWPFEDIEGMGKVILSGEAFGVESDAFSTEVIQNLPDVW